jgi:hypothetical protein
MTGLFDSHAKAENMKRFLCVVVFAIFATLLVPTERASADLITNGNFSAVTGDPANPFVGWTTDPSSGGDVPTVGTSPVTNAVFTESATALFVQLQQSLVIPATASFLAFDYRAAGDTQTGEPSGDNPDSFQATLFDNSNNPFAPVSSASPGFPGFYSVDVGGSDFRGPGVSVSPAPGLPGWTRVTLSLAALPHSDAIQPWTIEFLLNGSDDGQTSTVNLTNVQIQENGPATVPEPGTFLLAGLGFLGIAVYGKRSRGNAAP